MWAMTQPAQALLLAALIISTSVWVGGYVAIVVVARAATATLDSAARVAFFRTLGRSYLWVAGPALLVALVTGAILLHAHEPSALLISTIVLALTLVVFLAVAVAQARRMSRLRDDALAAPDDEQLAMRVRSGGQLAGILRAFLGVLSLTLVVLGSFLAV